MTKRPIIGIFLAAGKSSRMGQNKLMLAWNDSTIGSKSLEKAVQSRIDTVVVVTKPENSLGWLNPSFFSAQEKKKWLPVSCENADQGQAHSLRCGLKKAIELQARAVVVILADQPLIQSEMLNRLITHYEIHDRIDYIASSLNGNMRPPILFSESMFSQLMKLEGDIGARKLLLQYPKKQGTTIDYHDWRGFYDIDTKEDYAWIMTQNN
ncbi:NTP transferase domain-containing protein [Radiobacillus sp. PE A8.2]|uniref:NTP transferase domain-containing protein n=1 Tax=Radiobacillus sp. PE A8.2 TaxID=3380349 RepID=UPI00389080D5